MLDLSNYLSESEYAAHVGLSQQRINYLISRGRITDYIKLSDGRRYINKTAKIEPAKRSKKSKKI